jgi:hypothetical protein
MTCSTPPGGSWVRNPRGRALRGAAVVVAAVGQFIVLAPFTVASGLLAPLWAIVALYAIWAAAVAGLVLLARTRPFATLLVPIANIAVWWLVMTTGERILGWTG